MLREEEGAVKPSSNSFYFPPFLPSGFKSLIYSGILCVVSWKKSSRQNTLEHVSFPDRGPVGRRALSPAPSHYLLCFLAE